MPLKQFISQMFGITRPKSQNLNIFFYYMKAISPTLNLISVAFCYFYLYGIGLVKLGNKDYI
jgi:hypothetical protein